MTTLLKDLLQLHDQSLQEKDVKTDVDDDIIDSGDDTAAPKGDDADSEFTISMDESLFMRILEHTREEVKNDIELHQMVSAIEDLMKDNKRLTMDHYAAVISYGTEERPADKDDDKEDKDVDAEDDDAEDVGHQEEE